VSAVADKYKELQDLGCEVFSVSVDSHFVHKMWNDHELTKMVDGGVPFHMLSDQAGNIGRAYGVWDEAQGIELRGRFIIDPDGVIQAMETLTPPAMGGDVDLAEAKRRIGDRVCLVGGWDQFHFFQGCTPEQTRAEVRRCFEAAGAGGGFILSPSDHFFDADPELIMAFADEARRCTYY